MILIIKVGMSMINKKEKRAKKQKQVLIKWILNLLLSRAKNVSEKSSKSNFADHCPLQ